MHDTSTQTAVPVSDYAIIVNEKDNVAVVKNENAPGLVMQHPWGDLIELL
jgi:hypothetical protein